MNVYIVETRTVRIAREKEWYLACEPVFFASTLDRAETWMLEQHPGDSEHYYYCIMSSELDSDHDFELVGYYDILGQKSTLVRCLEAVLPQTKKSS
jgi:hypothetical protein